MPVYYSMDLDSFRYISHHGVKGQKWGVRRYQNEDGTLTEAGKKRLSNYTKYADKGDKKIAKYEAKANKHFAKGEKKASSFWSSKEATQNEFAKSNRYTSKANVTIQKLGEKYKKTVKGMDTSKLDKKFVKRGERYIAMTQLRRKNIYDRELERTISDGSTMVQRMIDDSNRKAAIDANLTALDFTMNASRH